MARTCTTLAALALTVLLAGCDSVTASASYTPPLPFPPITLSINSSGQISVRTGIEIVTPLGVFGLDVDAAHTLQVPNSSMDLVVRHKHNGLLVDEAFQVDSNEIVVTIDGHTVIKATNKTVFVDASQAVVRSIVITSPSPRDIMAQGYTYTDPLTRHNHDQNWDSDGQLCRFETQDYYLRPPGPDTFFGTTCHNKNLALRDAEITVTAQIVSVTPTASVPNPAGGACLNVRETGSSSIWITVQHDGYWRVGVGNDSWKSNSATSAMHTGFNVKNELRIRVSGNDVTFFINGQQVDHLAASDLNDPSTMPSQGAIALCGTGTSEVIFTNLVIKPL